MSGPGPDGSAAQPQLRPWLGGPDRSVLVLFGTETGNSEDIAEEIGRMAERLRFSVVVDEMDGVQLKHLLSFTLVIFVTSTTGQGDLPKNSSAFWKSLLRKRLPPTCLSSVKYTIFGLGDSSYPKFNWAARKLRKRLQQLGAGEFFPPGEGDERHDDGIDSIYLPWFQDLRARLLTDYPLPASLEPIPEDVQLPPKYILRLATNMNTGMDTEGNSTDDKECNEQFLKDRDKSAALSHINSPRPAKEQFDIDYDRSHGTSLPVLVRRDDSSERMFLGERSVDSLDKDNILKDSPDKYLLEPPSRAQPRPPPYDLLPIPNTYRATLHQNVRVTPPDHWQNVRFLKFYIADDNTVASPEVYPGSTLIIYPKNFPDDVDALINRMGWRDIADKPLEWMNENFQPDPSNLHVMRHCPTRLYAPKGATLRYLFLNNLDFTAIPKRSFIQDLAFFASDSEERDRLRELLKPSNTQEFYDYTTRPRRTILELLMDFPSVMIPWERVLTLFPIIRGREFSIANGANHLTPDDKSDDEGLVVEILAALVEYKTIIRKPRQGLCSRYLKYLEKGCDVQVGIKSNERSGPPWQGKHAARPLIAIATGTGIAPIRNLIHERHAPLRDLDSAPPTLLFFGCRNRAADFHFADEWAGLATYLEVVPAFSRDPVAPADAPDLDPYTEQWRVARPKADGGSGLEPKDPVSTGMLALDYDRGRNYVQHHIRRRSRRVCELVRNNAIVCVCGNSGRMPRSVRQALVDAFVLGGLAESSKEAEAIFDRLDFWQETW